MWIVTKRIININLNILECKLNDEANTGKSIKY